ncbi:MAG: maleylacetoacetate isomerase [Xanthomonadaceae bacterium]|nr:maleylacetoacetate isomerase [Xanthomonadaceae bacterium]
MTEQLKLYGYWRSSAAYRVRIALNLKGLDYEFVPVDLIRDGGDQLRPGYETTHPQRLIPVLQHGHRMIRQSLAIIEYIDEIWSSPPLLPIEPRDRAHTRALALLVACDIHPLNNLRVMRYLEREFDVPQPARDVWMRHWIEDGFRAFEAMLVDDLARGTFCEGDTPGLADCCLIPQIYNARRFNVDMAPYPTIRAIEAECMALPAFDAARPENQPDAPLS